MVKQKRKSRLLPSIQNKLLEQFVAGVSARTAAELTGVNRNTAILFFHKLREIIVEKMAAEAPFLAGEIEVDESYFGGVRKGKRGRGAAGKVPVFGLLKRGGKVYAMMIEDAKAQTLLGIIRDRIQPDSIVYTDSFRSYDVLDVSEFHHVRINHSEYISGKLLEWAEKHDITIQHIQPGKPQQNAYIERYNRTVRHEWLDQYIIESIEEAQKHATQWLWTYNNDSPKMGIGGITPAQKLKLRLAA
jgi:transposase